MFPSLALAPPIEAVRSWDDARERAYVRADPAALSRLYVAGSPAAVRDVALLRRYVVSGVRVSSMATQVFSSRVRSAGGGRVVVDLVDRVVATGADGRRCLALTSSIPQAHRVVLVRRTGRWVVGSVSQLDEVPTSARS